MPKPSSLVIAVLVAVLVFTGFQFFFTDVGAEFSQTSNFSELNKSDDILEAIPNISDIINTKVTGVAVLDLPFQAVGGVIQYLKLFGTILSSVWTDYISSIGSLLGIKGAYIALILAIIAIAVFASIITPVNKYPV